MSDYTLKAIMLIMADGTRYLALVVPSSFDTQVWANSRVESFKKLGVVSVQENY